MVGSFYDPELEEGCAFEELISFHGGIGGLQTRPFILHPTRARGSAGPDPRRRERARHPPGLATQLQGGPNGAAPASAGQVAPAEVA